MRLSRCLAVAAVLMLPAAARAQPCENPDLPGPAPAPITQSFFGHDARGGTYTGVGITTFFGCDRALALYHFGFQRLTYDVPGPSWVWGYNVEKLAPFPWYECCPLGPFFGTTARGQTFDGIGELEPLITLVTVPSQSRITFPLWTPPPPPESRSFPSFTVFPPNDVVVLTAIPDPPTLATPEPAMLALVGTGLLALGGVAHTRRRRV